MAQYIDWRRKARYLAGNGRGNTSIPLHHPKKPKCSQAKLAQFEEEARDTKSATGLAVLKPDGFNTERRSDGETELSRLRGSEGYEVRDRFSSIEAGWLQ